VEWSEGVAPGATVTETATEQEEEVEVSGSSEVEVEVEVDGGEKLDDELTPLALSSPARSSAAASDAAAEQERTVTCPESTHSSPGRRWKRQGSGRRRSGSEDEGIGVVRRRASEEKK
jgi:hypothetical protein